MDHFPSKPFTTKYRQWHTGATPQANRSIVLPSVCVSFIVVSNMILSQSHHLSYSLQPFKGNGFFCLSPKRGTNFNTNYSRLFSYVFLMGDLHFLFKMRNIIVISYNLFINLKRRISNDKLARVIASKNINEIGKNDPTLIVPSCLSDASYLLNKLNKTKQKRGHNDFHSHKRQKEC